MAQKPLNIVNSSHGLLYSKLITQGLSIWHCGEFNKTVWPTLEWWMKWEKLTLD